MFVSKALQFMDKKDLECAICLNRFNNPKTLKCMHTYCLQCIQKWVESHGKMKCPTCGQEHDLTKEDLKKLASNTMISQLLDYVMKTEDQKPTKCSCCDNKPAYHCPTCQLYLCGSQCVKQHKMIPSTKDHPLYTIDMKAQDDTQKCPAHCNTTLEFYCTICNKSACKQCEHLLHCCQKQHEVIPISTAVDEFNKDAKEIVEFANEIENELTEKLEILSKDRLKFASKVNLCRTAIEIQEKKLIKKVQEKSKELISDLETIYKGKAEKIDSEAKDIDSKMTQVRNVIVSINSIMNKPEKTETLSSYKTTINAVKDNVLRTDFEQSFQKRNTTPNFTPSMHLNELMNTESIGKITTVDSLTYKVAEDDEKITVTKGQPFVVKVSSATENDTFELAATLLNSSGEELASEIEYQDGGEYKITGRCNMEGDWQMKITAGAAHIKGSPINVKVEALGLVYTINNISDYKEHNKTETVVDVVLDRDGFILVSSSSKDILKFNQSGSFIARIQAPQVVDFMHSMGDGQMLYCEDSGPCVVLCDDTLQEIRSFGEGILEGTLGLTVNNATRIMYVADFKAHCVHQFNVDDGRHLGTIGSMGSELGQMLQPMDVTITKEGYVVVADNGNRRIQMFDANGKYIRSLDVQSGDDDDKDGDEDDEDVDDNDEDYFDSKGPFGVTTDFDDNILVSSFYHYLQLFDKNGFFIKQIQVNHEEVPWGVCVISNRPRRVAVANHKRNNVKIFNY